MVFFLFQIKLDRMQSNMFTVAGERALRRALNIFPASEKLHSDFEDDAGMQRMHLTTRLRLGNN